MKNGVLLIILNDDEVEDATSLSEEDKDKMLVMIEMDIQELKINEQCTECVHIQLYQNKEKLEAKYSTRFICHLFSSRTNSEYQLCDVYVIHDLCPS